jgi:peptidoglycan/LPS O-acetylase OafA/YrhL
MKQSTAPGAIPVRHLYSLDILRGIAALGVVLFHWQNFFTTPGSAPMIVERFPLPAVFSLFFSEGWRAVDLFFCLSGFVFYFLYAVRIAERRVTLKEFALLRFSRLYPLHFVTLLFMAVAQWVMVKNTGASFVCGNNNVHNFILQLFLAPSWKWNPSLNFNGPIWSVSIEVLLYAVFFIACLRQLHRWWHLALFALLGLALPGPQLIYLSRGIFSFFIGGLTYLAFSRIRQQGIHIAWLAALIGLTALLWVIVPWNDHVHHDIQTEHTSVWQNYFLNRHAPVHFIFSELTQGSYTAVLFPLTIFTLACVEVTRGTLGKRLAFVGNISYSVYLIHFPLQVVFAGTAIALSLPQTIFYSPWMVLAFFATLIPLSLGSFYCFERPVQNWIRARWLMRNKTPVGPVVEKGA